MEKYGVSRFAGAMTAIALATCFLLFVQGVMSSDTGMQALWFMVTVVFVLVIVVVLSKLSDKKRPKRGKGDHERL